VNLDTLVEWTNWELGTDGWGSFAYHGRELSETAWWPGDKTVVALADKQRAQKKFSWRRSCEGWQNYIFSRFAKGHGTDSLPIPPPRTNNKYINADLNQKLTNLVDLEQQRPGVLIIKGLQKNCGRYTYDGACDYAKSFGNYIGTPIIGKDTDIWAGILRRHIRTQKKLRKDRDHRIRGSDILTHICTTEIMPKELM